MVSEFKLTTVESSGARSTGVAGRSVQHRNSVKQSSVAKPKNNRIKELAQSGNGNKGAAGMASIEGDKECIIPLDDNFADF
jgi:hypothetical protein